MQNIGEEICGQYLKHVEKCDFVSYNVSHPDTQGEIDVIGISLASKQIFVCEVAIHTGGLQYVTNKRPDDFNRFNSKFTKSIGYVRKYFPNYKNVTPMLWSPVVRVGTEKANYDTYLELVRLKDEVKKVHGLDLHLIINSEFDTAMQTLRKIASSFSEELTSPVMRIFQIEAKLQGHLKKLAKRKK